MEIIKPVKIYYQNIELINIIFRSIPNINIEKIPSLKIGILGSGVDILDKMFVVEDGPNVLMFMKNVKNSKSLYRRSAYMIVRSKVKYVHFRTGVIFSTIKEFADLEKDFFESEYVIEGENIVDKTGKKIENPNFYEYMYYRSNTLQTLIGYYIPESSIINFHPVTYFNNKFGDYDYEFIKYIFYRVYEESFIEFLLNKQFNDTSGNKRRSVLSLKSTIEGFKNEQERRTIISLFICEMLFGLFF